MTTTDPRRGRPSCSALHRLSNCPASFWLSQGMPDTAGDDAASGTRIHEWLEKETDELWHGLTPDEQQTAEMCKQQINKLVEDWKHENVHN